MQDSFGQAGADPGRVQLIIDQLEELIVTIIEEVRERPGVAAALLAAVIGVIVGTALASRAGERRGSAPRKVVRRARGIADAGDLAGLAIKLLQNPIVRGYVMAAVSKQLKRRASF